MPKKKVATPANTGLNITRESNKFSASWTIKAQKVTKQSIRYRTNNGAQWSDWTTKELNKSATSFSFDLSPSAKITDIEVQTQVKRSNTSKVKYLVSAWESSAAKFTPEVPPKPTLSVSKDSANMTTFSWSIETDDTAKKWYFRTYYRTKCTTTPDSASGWGAWTYATADSYTFTDNTLGTTRIFQIKSVGPAGDSAIVTERHIINTAPIATWADKNPVTYTKETSYYQMTYNCNIKGSAYNVDSIVPQYVVTTPSSTMGVPNGTSWTDGTTYNYSNGKSNYTLAITTSELVSDDKCLFCRVKTVHDNVESYSKALRIITGKLSTPDVTITTTTPSQSGFTVNITVNDWETDVPGTFMQVFLEKASKTGQANYIKLGKVNNGAASASINSTIDLTGEAGYAIHVRNVTSDGISMVSGYASMSVSMPSAPTLSSVLATTTPGKVYLEWTNNWSDATGVIIAWTDDPDNWMSNDDPETYEITETASNWYITGLETGKTWYFRVRSVKTERDAQAFSGWSAEKTIDLSSAPAVPVLYLSDETITEEGMVTAYWSYVSTDGTGQIAGNIVQATYSGGAWSYGKSIGATTTEQHIDLYAVDNGWTNGQTVYLALQTRSGSGGLSEYSTPVQLVIADKPKVSITATSFANQDTVTEYFVGDGVTTQFNCMYSNISTTPTILIDNVRVSPMYNALLRDNGNNLVDNSGNKLIATLRNIVSYENGTIVFSSAPADDSDIKVTYTTKGTKTLRAMPLTATITTTSAASLTVAIERAVTYPMVRPDGEHTDGAEGETVYVNTIPAEASNAISIGVDNLIGRLDDGAWYTLVATAKDRFGQTNEQRIPFRVHWSHQAWVPTATFVTDSTEYIAKITPVAGASYVSGDTCDIYRLSTDKPELIVQGADFGTQYVDPYPAFGENSGYKIVTVTETKDYITPSNDFAEYDTVIAEDNAYTQLKPGLMVIDFDGDRIEMEYNISLDNSWDKDFKRTVYLGGHVAGDHNKAVTRDLTASSILFRANNDDVDQQMRHLADYPGLCHIRTPEGSSFTADIQVTEAQAFDSAQIEYSLKIQKVDSVGFDGMTYAEWSAQQ